MLERVRVWLRTTMPVILVAVWLPLSFLARRAQSFGVGWRDGGWEPGGEASFRVARDPTQARQFCLACPAGAQVWQANEPGMDLEGSEPPPRPGGRGTGELCRVAPVGRDSVQAWWFAQGAAGEPRAPSGA